MTAERLAPETAADLRRLESAIAGHGPMVVAFSGGVDSGLLAFAARRVLGDGMMCVIGVSPSLASGEEQAALSFLEEHGIPYARIETHEGDDPGYRANGPDRCYFCKRELFARIETAPESRAFPVLAYGANADDRHDFRPGARAAGERGVVAPLAEAGFTKEMVRRVARALALVLWDKPASPCLASRIPYYSAVTPGKLAQVDRAEAGLKALGFRVCRVRHNGDTARIEVPVEMLGTIRRPEVLERVEVCVRDAGFERAEIDVGGFRSGRLNDALHRSP